MVSRVLGFIRDAVIGYTYQVQGSTDSIHWENIGDPIVADEAVEFIVDETWARQKFYRILLIE